MTAMPQDTDSLRHAPRKQQTLPERAPSAQPQQESQQEASAPSPLPVGYPDQTQAQLPQSEFHPCDDQGLSPSLSSNASFYPAAEVRNHERDGGCNEEATTEVPNHTPHTASPNHPYMHSSPEFVIDELTALRNFSNNAASFPQTAQEAYQGIASPLFDHSVFSDPVNDVFLPGSAYEALHTTLRNRQLWTARPDIPSRCSSPASVPESGAVTPNGLQPSEVNNYSRPSRPFELSPARENVLWQNYLNEICLWVCSTPNVGVVNLFTDQSAGHVRQPSSLCLDLPSDGQVIATPPLFYLSLIGPPDRAKTKPEIPVRKPFLVPGGNPSPPPGARKQDDASDSVLCDLMCIGNAKLCATYPFK
ncbi:unnamed protein product [Aspergillus oryzae]|nr:unnamed protein product [Aspergillus oryzae]GMF89427.1 unnamed protein product [Aspergillus oryzae]